MKTKLFAAIAVCAATQVANAEDPNPAQVHSRPAPAARPPVAAAPAPQARPQVPQARIQRVAPSAAGPHGLGLGGGVYRSVPSYTARQFHPTTEMPAYGRNWNRTPTTVATGVTPRAGNVPQQNVTANSGGRTPNSPGRTWQGRPTANTPVANGGQNPTGRGTNNWRGGNGGNHNNYANWQDARRHYDHQHHDRDWWHRHHTNVVFVNNGYYYWDAGWWYPAWGYDPAAQYYAYDGPIYGYDGQPPDQVIANVQSALQQEGYYQGEVDGELGPMTQQALAAWQRDHGLTITTAIDYPTLASLGLS
ncbi:MAG: peptidoglycan-binding protein [Chthoniobacterales bacterium]